LGQLPEGDASSANQGVSPNGNGVPNSFAFRTDTQTVARCGPQACCAPLRSWRPAHPLSISRVLARCQTRTGAAWSLGSGAWAGRVASHAPSQSSPKPAVGRAAEPATCAIRNQTHPLAGTSQWRSRGKDKADARGAKAGGGASEGTAEPLHRDRGPGTV